MNDINYSFFAPLFEDYIEKSKVVRKCGYWQLPFIPYTFPNYKTSPKKFFYVGRDTYYWCEYDSMYDENGEAAPLTYLMNNANYVSTENIRNDWGKSGAFWNMVGKLHLQLLTGTYHESIDELSIKDWELLKGIGYGNLFSIELPDTLKKKKYSPNGEAKERCEYNDLNDLSAYRELQEMAKPFENLKTIFLAYGEPDIVFVFSWVDKDEFFEDLDYEWQEKWFEEGKRAVYVSKTHKTKVIWTSHPNRFHFLKTSAKDMCLYLVDTANKLLGNHIIHE